MNKIPNMVDLYEQGLYTFGETVSYFIRLAESTPPNTFFHELPADFAVSIAVEVACPPKSPDEIWYMRDSGTNAKLHYQGARALHDFLFDSLPVE